MDALRLKNLQMQLAESYRGDFSNLEARKVSTDIQKELQYMPIKHGKVSKFEHLFKIN